MSLGEESVSSMRGSRPTMASHRNDSNFDEFLAAAREDSENNKDRPARRRESVRNSSRSSRSSRSSQSERLSGRLGISGRLSAASVDADGQREGGLAAGGAPAAADWVAEAERSLKMSQLIIDGAATDDAKQRRDSVEQLAADQLSELLRLPSLSRTASKARLPDGLPPGAPPADALSRLPSLLRATSSAEIAHADKRGGARSEAPPRGLSRTTSLVSCPAHGSARRRQLPPPGMPPELGLLSRTTSLPMLSASHSSTKPPPKGLPPGFSMAETLELSRMPTLTRKMSRTKIGFEH